MRVPTSVWQKLGVEPPQEVELTLGIGASVLSRLPVQVTEKDQAHLDRAAEFLRASLAGVNADQAWAEIHAARRERCF